MGLLKGTVDEAVVVVDVGGGGRGGGGGGGAFMAMSPRLHSDAGAKTGGEYLLWWNIFVRLGKLGGESEGGERVISRVRLTVGQ